jgi:hypothetical protein
MSWTNPFADTGGSGLNETEVQGVIDALTISPIYTNQTTAHDNLTNYEIVRVSLASNTITLPDGVEGLRVRILNVLMADLDVKDGSGTTVSTMYCELVSFYYTNDEWVVFSGY